MCACGTHFDTRFVRSVFCDALVAAENLYYSFFAAAKKLCEALPLIANSSPEKGADNRI